MIKLITGAKGSGKTKRIIDMANANIETAKGDIIFVTDTDRYMYELRYQIRNINTKCLRHEDKTIYVESLIGFIKGILAGNHDIESFYIDGAHRILNKPVIEMEQFFNELYKITQNDKKIEFIVTVSEDEKNFPKFLKQYQGEL